MNINRSIKITQSNAQSNVNIKVLPVNEFTKEHNKQLFIQFVKPTENQHDILQFMDDSTSNYKFSDKPIFLQQIINKRAAKSNNEPEFGMGSSFKKERKTTNIQSNAPPTYAITIDKGKAQRKFKTVPQQLNSTSQYLVLVRKSQTLFHAYPVQNWYKINPYSQLDIGSIEENEREQLLENEAFSKGSKKILERYQVTASEHLKSDIVYGNEEDELSDSEKLEKDILNKRKRNDVFQRIRHGRGDAQAESDHDDHQGDEVDYMSDSSCDEDKLSEDEKDKLYDTVDVVQEQFLRNELDLSDDEENEVEKKEEKTEDENNVVEDEEDDEDDDDNDDDDSEDDISEDELPANKKQKNDFNNNLVAAAVKRPNSDNIQFDMKKRKLSNYKVDDILEEMRKHLKRKPLSNKDLFKILMKKNLLENNDDSKTLYMECIGRLRVKTEIVQGIKMHSL